MSSVSRLPFTLATNRLIGTLVVVVAVLLPWFSAGDHPLYSPDEGRYGAASRAMAEGGSLLVPTLYGQPHLTKPPLTYWLQAASMEVLGPSELAVRLPSLLASSLVVLIALAVGRGVRSTRTGVLASALLAMMPLFLGMSRLGTTDALLNLWWTAIIASALMAVHTGLGRWWFAMWAAASAGILTKGPVPIIPLFCVVAWLALAGRWRTLVRPWMLVGAVLAVVPYAVWAVAVLLRYPDAAEVWRQQYVDRVVTSDVRPEPFWFYLPVFLAGMFPATAMLTLPGWNLTWRRSWLVLRSGNAIALLALGVVVPLAAFSASTGKMPTYILPVGPSLAVLVALMLDDRLRGLDAKPLPRQGRLRQPDVIHTLFISTTIVAVVLTVVAATGDVVPWVGTLPFAAIPIAAAFLARRWQRGTESRAVGMLAVFVAWSASVAWGTVLEDNARALTDPRLALDRIKAATGQDAPAVTIVGLKDPTLYFYAGLRGGFSSVLPPDRQRGDLFIIDRQQYEQFGGGSDWSDLVERTEVRLWPSRRMVVLEAEPPLGPIAPSDR